MRSLPIIFAIALSLFADPQTDFQKCVICHGKYAQKAMGSKTAPQDLSEQIIVYSLTKYRDNYQTSSGNTKIMATNVRNFTDQQIKELAAHIKDIDAKRQQEIEQETDEKLKNMY